MGQSSGIGKVFNCMVKLDLESDADDRIELSAEQYLVQTFPFFIQDICGVLIALLAVL